MPVPKVRTSKSRRNTRRSHHFLRPAGYSLCPNCNTVKLPHHVCLACGYYRGQQVLEVAKQDEEADDFAKPGAE